MPMAYILLNTEIGSERDVLDEVRRIKGVQQAFSVIGLYDVIAQISADSTDKLAQIISSGFQLSKVHTKLTIMISEPSEEQSEVLACE